MKRNELINFINDYLCIKDFDDYCINGLQVEGKDEINNIILGTTISLKLIQGCVERNGDMIIVHHGLFWKNNPSIMSVTGSMKKRLELLIKNDINLAGYHLPLDAHEQIGNNVQLCRMLGLEILEPIKIGWLGKCNLGITFEQYVEKVNKTFDVNSFAIKGNTRKIKRVLVISGGAESYYEDALKCSADLFITGGIKESLVRTIEEEGLNFINIGHYNSEKYGIQALGKVIMSEYGINCEYIDIPNPA